MSKEGREGMVAYFSQKKSINFWGKKREIVDILRGFILHLQTKTVKK